MTLQIFSYGLFWQKYLFYLLQTTLKSLSVCKLLLNLINDCIMKAKHQSINILDYWETSKANVIKIGLILSRETLFGTLIFNFFTTLPLFCFTPTLSMLFLFSPSASQGCTPWYSPVIWPGGGALRILWGLEFWPFRIFCGLCYWLSWNSYYDILGWHEMGVNIQLLNFI